MHSPYFCTIYNDSYVNWMTNKITCLTLMSFSMHNGEGNGDPLQYSCLENPRDRGAWWAAVYGVAQRWTQLKQLSSSSRPAPFSGWLGVPWSAGPRVFSFASLLSSPRVAPSRLSTGCCCCKSSFLIWALLFLAVALPRKISCLLSPLENCSCLFLMGFSGGSDSKESACNAGDPGLIPGLGRSPLEKSTATHSSTLAWRILWTEEPGGLQSIRSQ